MRQFIVDGKAGLWAAIRLSDGGCDGIAYATKRDAIRFQLWENQCAYLRIPRDDCPPREAAGILKIHRELYDKGLRLADPDDDPGREVIAPWKLEDLELAVGDLMRRAGLT